MSASRGNRGSLPFIFGVEGLKELLDVLVFELLQLKGVLVLLPNVLVPSYTLQIVCQVHQLLVFRVLVEGQDGNAIVQLEPKGVDSVVNNHHVF